MSTHANPSETNDTQKSTSNLSSPFFSSRNASENSFFKKAPFYQNMDPASKTIKEDLLSKDEMEKIINDILCRIRIVDSIQENNLLKLTSNYDNRKEINTSITDYNKHIDLLKEKLTLYADEFKTIDAYLDPTLKDAEAKKRLLEDAFKDAKAIIELTTISKKDNEYNEKVESQKNYMLNFSMLYPDIDSLVEDWQREINSFKKLYAESSDAVKRFGERKSGTLNNLAERNKDISSRNISWICEKFSSNRYQKDVKDEFDKSMNGLSESEKIKKNPPLKDSKEEEFNKSHEDLFEKGKKDKYEIDSNDVVQGQLGDCYYLATIASIAKVNPEYFKSVIEKIPVDKNAFDAYKITFYIQDSKEKNTIKKKWLLTIIYQ